jgi:hypothetical protein
LRTSQQEEKQRTPSTIRHHNTTGRQHQEASIHHGQDNGFTFTNSATTEIPTNGKHKTNNQDTA